MMEAAVKRSGKEEREREKEVDRVLRMFHPKFPLFFFFFFALAAHTFISARAYKYI